MARRCSAALRSSTTLLLKRLLTVEPLLQRSLTLRDASLLCGLLLFDASLQRSLALRHALFLGYPLLRDASLEHRVTLKLLRLCDLLPLECLLLTHHCRIGRGGLRQHRWRRRCGIRREALRLRPVVVAALVVADRLFVVAAGRAVGAGEIADRIGHVGVGIEQAAGVAAVAHGAGGAEPDLHQAVIAGADDTRVALALDMDDAADQGFRHAMGRGVLGNEVIVFAGARGLPGEWDRRQ